MWKLPDGRIIKTADRKRMFTIGDVQHPQSNLLYWDDAALADLGILRFVEIPFDQVNYRSTGFNDVEADGVITRTHTTEPKEPLDEVKKKRIRQARTQASHLIEPTNWFQVRELDEDSKPMPRRVLNYRIAVRAVCNTIEENIKAFTTLDEVLTYNWDDQWPDPVDAEEPIIMSAAIATPSRT